MIYDKTNKGVLNFMRKVEGKQPQYKGKINIDGEEFSLAGWLRDGPFGEFISLTIQTAEEAAKYANKDDGGENESIPF